jgi:hypothetical protein
VEATVYLSHVERLPEVRKGECVLLKRFKVFLNGSKIPCIESRSDSGWFVWDHLGNPACHAGLGPVATTDVEEMQRLRAWSDIR